ncbi:MAG: thiamine pyrophosphate-binding protein [Thermomicrobium sp.]|nr:thiamine pyrophosphate-binding protein [Thermomicrobium sp.]
MASVAEVVAQELRAAEVDRAFGLPGGEVLVLLDALRRAGIAFTLCRHEAVAGTAAAVYGKLRRTAGVAVATLGPGAANLMLPLANAWLDREPLLAITADLPATWPLTHTHQRLPLHDVYRPIVKYGAAVTPLDPHRPVRQALQACTSEPHGPAYLTLSAEDAGQPARLVTREEPANRELRPDDDARAAARELAERLATAERPLVLVGLGVRPERAPLLRRWLQAWRLPVAVTPKAKGLVDEQDEATDFVGVVGGMAIDDLMVEALRRADLLVGFGFDPVEVDKTWHAQLPIVWVLESAQAAGVLPRRDVLLADHGALLAALDELAPPRRWERPFGEFQAERAAIAAGRSRAPAEGLAPVRIVEALARVLPAETIVTTDVGSHKYLFGQFWPSRQPETFWMSNGLSGMGYGLAAAIGAKLARPEAPVLAALGDGGFSMVCQELETARRVGAPIIVLVIADRSYSLIRIGQENRGLPRYGVDFEPIDSVLVAQACGCAGTVARTAEELAAAAEQALAATRSGLPFVIEVPLDPEAYRPIV